MTAVDLAAADPLAVALKHLRAHPRVLEALDDDPLRVGSRNEAPFPRVRLRYTPGGSDRDLRWLMAPEVQVEVYGDMDGTPSSAVMRAIMYRVLAALKELPEREPDPADAVITAVVSSGGAGPAPEPTGQVRWASTVVLYNHPPMPTV